MFESTLSRVAGLGEALAAVLDVLDPDAVSPSAAEDLWSGFDRLERLASAGKTLLARRAAEGPGPAPGEAARYRSGVERLAARAGCGVGSAREAVETSKRLAGGNAAGVAAALRRGQLSGPQAAAVSAAAQADPSAEERLLDLAGRASLPELREECARVRAAADPDPVARNARLHRARRLRRFTDAEGAWQLMARGTPQAGAAFNAVLEPLIDQVFRAARRDGRREPVEAYAFDALMVMADHAAGDTQPGDVARSSNAAGGAAPGGGRAGGDGVDRGAEAGKGLGGEAGEGLGAVAETCPSDVRGRGSAGDAAQMDRGSAEETFPSAAPTSTDQDAPWWAAAQGVLLGPHGAGDDGEDRGDHAPSASATPWWRTAHLLGDPPRPPGSGADEGDHRTGDSVSRRLVVPGEGAARAARGKGEQRAPQRPRAPEPPPPARASAASPVPGQRVPRNPRHLALLRLDLAALHRGSVAGDEMCEIAGVGPVPVEVARGLLGDAVLKLVITRGVDVLHVTHLGRGPTAAQRVALAWQSPTCAVEGCWRRRVEIDHREEWARTRHTRLDELDPLCGQHHDLKTRFGWALVRGTGKRAFVPPSDDRHPRHQRHQRTGTAGDRPGPQEPPHTVNTAAPDAVSRDCSVVPPARPSARALVEDATTARSGTRLPPGERGAARAGTPAGRGRRGHRRSTVTAPLFEDGLP